jgi:hypothetical protein
VGLRLQKDEKYKGKRIYVNAFVQENCLDVRVNHANVFMLRYTEPLNNR